VGLKLRGQRQAVLRVPDRGAALGKSRAAKIRSENIK
jgi:hypothetical protein